MVIHSNSDFAFKFHNLMLLTQILPWFIAPFAIMSKEIVFLCYIFAVLFALWVPLIPVLLFFSILFILSLIIDFFVFGHLSCTLNIVCRSDGGMLNKRHVTY